MTIEARCENCGKLLRAPESAAGRRAKCPACGDAVQIPDGEQEAIFDAEVIQSDEPEDYEDDDAWGGDAAVDYEDYEPRRRPPPRQQKRLPCPACGEKIVSTARVCRFCGERFDGREARGSGRVSRATIEKFRREAHGLGGFWIFVAVVSVLVGIALASGGLRGVFPPGQAEVIGLVVILGGVLFLIAGIFTCSKQKWAIVMGLVLSYIALVDGLVLLAQNPCGGALRLALFLAAVVQAHRVLGIAGEMERAGVPLDQRS